MRINDTYEHEAILPYQTPEDACSVNGCNKVTTHCVDVTAPLTLTPTASIGKVTVACQGDPTVSCDSNPTGTSCIVTLTQKICVTVPVRYGVSMSADEPKIDCNCCGSGGGCSCPCC